MRRHNRNAGLLPGAKVIYRARLFSLYALLGQFKISPMRRVACCLLALLGVSAFAQQVQQVPVGSVPRGLAFHPARNQLVVGSFGDNSVNVLDLATLRFRTVTSVATPAGVAVDDELGLAVVTNSGGNEVTIINLATLQVVNRVPVESTPLSVDINTSTHIAVVSNNASRTISLVDLRTVRVIGVISDVPVLADTVQAVAVNSITNVAVVANTTLNSITLVDLARRSIIDTVPVGPRPVAVAINPITNVAVVANSSGNSVSIVNLANRQVVEVPVPAPQGVAIHALSNTAIVSTLTNEVVFLDLGTNREVARATSLLGPVAAAANQVARQAAVVLPPDNSIALLTLPGSLLSRLTVVNAASFRTGNTAAGAIVSGFSAGMAAASLTTATSVPLPTTLGDTTVRVASTDAPLFFVSQTQVNFQVPTGLSGRQTVQVQRNRVAVATGEINIGTASPALFTLTQTGSGPAAALNQDNTLVSTDGCIANAKPAAPGSAVQLFGTGQGALSPPVSAGQPAPVSPPSTTPTMPTVTLGGQAVTVEFSGAAPNLVGAWQINIRIPSSPPSGAAVPLVVTMLGQTSPATATLAVNTALQPCTR